MNPLRGFSAYRLAARVQQKMWDTLSPRGEGGPLWHLGNRVARPPGFGVRRIFSASGLAADPNDAGPRYPNHNL